MSESDDADCQRDQRARRHDPAAGTPTRGPLDDRNGARFATSSTAERSLVKSDSDISGRYLRRVGQQRGELGPAPGQAGLDGAHCHPGDLGNLGDR